MRTPRIVSSAVIVAVCSLLSTAAAQQAISPFVIASGGGLQTGQNISVIGTIGQPIAGSTSKLLAGFWYGSGSTAATSIEDTAVDPSLPSTFRVHQNYPNPFNPSTTIVYELPEPVDVTISIFDVLGRLVSQVDFADQTVGIHSARWDGRDGSGALVPSGTYWFRVQAGTNSSVRMMILLK